MEGSDELDQSVDENNAIEKKAEKSEKEAPTLRVKFWEGFRFICQHIPEEKSNENINCVEFWSDRKDFSVFVTNSL